MLVCRVSLYDCPYHSFTYLMTNRRGFQALSGAALIITLVVAWTILAPIQFGGQVAYVIVNGNSMWPALHWDDLVILRRASTYQVGDIVAYHDPKVGPVIHRIIKQESDHFVLKGDHNDFIDPYHPTQAELIGKLWIRLPIVGCYTEQIRTPQILTLLAAVVGTIAMTTAMTPTKDSKNKRKHRFLKHPAAHQLGANITDILLAAGAIAAASLVLAVFAFTRPTHHYATENIDYQQTGVFSYSASAPPGVYDSETVQPGEPIFRRLIDEVTVNFEYQLAADLPGPVYGTYRLIAELSGVNGWKRTLELQPEAIFSGHTFATASTIDLSEIQTLLEDFEKQVDIRRNTYRLAVVPQVSIKGQVAGQTLEDRFAPRLVFEFSDLQMQLVRTGDADPLRPSQPGQLSRTVMRPNTLSILGLSLDVSTARKISLIVLALSVSVAEVLGLMILYNIQGGEAARIRLKYGSMLIDIQDGNVAANAKRRIVGVGSIDSLAKIAEANGGMILHLTRGNIDYYLVQGADALFCFRTPNGNDGQLQKGAILQTQDAWEI